MNSQSSASEDKMRGAPDESLIRQAVGANIQRWREQAKLSRADLAKQADTGTRNIIRIETGSGLPGLVLLFRIASVLGVHPGVLLMLDDPGLDMAGLLASASEAISRA